jgi:hypothetical protein
MWKGFVKSALFSCEHKEICLKWQRYIMNIDIFVFF